jgi:cytochrome P450 family 9
VLRDPELIKQVGIKQFDNFMEHRVFIDETMDPLLGNALVSLTGQKWRDMRATLSPVFTGSKMRQMFELVTKCGAQMVSTFQRDAKSQGALTHDMKELFSRFTIDVVATSAFGIEVNSFEDKENLFFTLGKEMLNFKSATSAFKLMGFFLAPWLLRLLDISLLDPKVSEYFTEVIRKNFYSREQNKIVRNDVIHLLMQLKKGQLERPAEEKPNDAGFATVEESELGKQLVNRKWSETELIAQCFVFFLAGFSTTSELLSFLSYELALNPEIQQRLYEEILDMNGKLNGDALTYEGVQKMKYLDMVISEGLRKWPPALVTERMCTRDCSLQFDGKSVEIKKGINIWIPIYALHHDEKYFPMPEKFDPERFSDQNKGGINLGAYLPFGIGPRNCIGKIPRKKIHKNF